MCEIPLLPKDFMLGSLNTMWEDRKGKETGM